MDASELLDRVRTDCGTELDRLGSEKSLLAATEAQLESGPVLRTVATALARSRDAISAWADDAEGEAADALAAAAGTLEEAYETVAAELDGDIATDAEPPFLSFDIEGDIERVGAGTVGVGLVLDGLCLQAVSFFVNEADTARADLFRGLRNDLEGLRETGADALEDLCRGDDWERAVAGATGVIEAAYDDYARRLDAMGFDPKPIC